MNPALPVTSQRVRIATQPIARLGYRIVSRTSSRHNARSQPPYPYSARAQRSASDWHLTSTKSPPGSQLARRSPRPGVLENRCARPPQPARARVGSCPTGQSSCRTHGPLRSESATGSCTMTSAPYERSSWITSMTREFRRSGQFSLNVSPSTIIFARFDRESCLDHLLDGLLGDVFAHAVVDPASGQDHLRMVAELVGLVGEVIRVDADAMPADQSRPKRQEVPFRSRGIQHFGRVDADLMEDQRELVHQRDVEIALRVLDHLGCFGDLDRRGADGRRPR